MAVAITINSFYRDNGAKAAERSMKRLERIAKDNGTVLTDSQRKSAVSIQKMANAGDKFKQVGAGMQSFGSAMTRNVTLPVAAASAASISAFKDFDDALAQSYAIMGDIDQKTKDKMSGVAREVATTTRTTHKEAAASYYYLASAGLDAQQSIAALPAVARFAQAGMFDMETATSLAADAQSSLGLKSKDAQKNLKGMVRVTDVLTKANILANGSVEDFSIALTTKAGAALKTTHKSVEEGTAVLAALADQGVKGADAGQALNQFLRDIPRAANKNSEAFKKLGISVFDSKGNMKNAAVIMKEFEKGLGGMSDKQKAAAFEAMGLNRGVQGVIKQLLGSSGAIRTYQKGLEDASGVTEDVANKQLNSAQAKFDLAKNKLTDAAISAGPALMKAVTPVLKYVTELADKFSKLPASQQEFIVKAALITAAVGPTISAIGKLTSGVGSLLTTSAKIRSWALNRKITETGTAAASASPAMTTFAGNIGMIGGATTIAAAAALGSLAFSMYNLGKAANNYIDASATARNAAADADFYASAEGRVITASRVAAAAKRENAAATDAVRTAEELASGAALDLEGATLSVERAHKSAAYAKRTYGKGSLEYREASYQEKVAKQQLTTAEKSNADAKAKVGLANARYMMSVKGAANADIAFKKSQDELRDKMAKTGTGAKAAGKKIGTGYASGVKSGASTTKSASKTLGKSATSGLLATITAKSRGLKNANAFSIGVSNGRGSARTAGSAIAKSAAGSMNKTHGAQSSGKHVAAGFANGITLGKFSVITAAKNLVVNAINAIKSKAGINSPARLFYAPGKYISLGLAKGIKAGSKDVEKAADTLAQRAYARIQKIKDRNKARVERGKDIASTWGFFDMPDGNNETTKTVTTGKTLSAGTWGTSTKEVTTKASPLEAIKAQNSALKSWSADLTKLKSAGASKSLIKALRQAGPSNYSDVASLASMSKADIAEYSKLYTQRQKIGYSYAQKELGKTENTNVTVQKGAFNITIHDAGKMTEAKLEKAIVTAINKALKKSTKKR